MSIRRMPYGSTIPFSNHLVASSDSTQSSGDSENTGGGDSSTPQTIYELINPYLIEDDGFFLEQAGDTPPGNASSYDNGYMLFDGFDDPNDELTNPPTQPNQSSPPTGIRWLIWDGSTQNGYGTIVYDLISPRTITSIAFFNVGTLNGLNLNAETIEVYVSNNSSVPTASSTKIIDLSNQGNVNRTGLINVTSPTSFRYLRIKVSHANSFGTHLYGLTGVKLYGYPFAGLISPRRLRADDGNITVSGTGYTGPFGPHNLAHGWNAFDGSKNFNDAQTSQDYPDSMGWLGDTASGSWFMYDFGSAKTVRYMKFWNYDQVLSGGVYTKGVDSLTISGSNDNITFTDLVTDTGKGSTPSWATPIPTPAAYRYYKITVNNHTSSAETVCGFIELEIYGE